jgi:hypothetical protein
MAARKRPPKALRDGLTKLFEQHDWPGGMPAALIPSAGPPPSGTCPPGTTPHDITYQDANGNWVSTTVCI